MDKILQTQPTSVFKIKDEYLTYEQIQHAIATKNTNRLLQGIVSTCKAYPDTVVFVIYKSFSESVLLVFGKDPTTIILEGNKIKKNMMPTSEKDYLYVFTHKI